MLLMAMAALIILFLPPKFLTALWKRVTFIAMSFALFVVIRAAASAFYPAAPESMSEFLESFTRGVQYVSC